MVITQVPKVAINLLAASGQSIGNATGQLIDCVGHVNEVAYKVKNQDRNQMRMRSKIH
jgi:hypothetical protein